MKKTILLIGLLLSSTTLLAAGSVMEQGRFALHHPATFEEFQAGLMKFESFSTIYINETRGEGLERCSGWNDFAYLSPTHIDLCTIAHRMGFEIRVVSKFTAAPKANSNYLGCINYNLKFMKGTSPGLLLDNVDSLNTDFCLEKNGNTVAYTANIVNGPRKGFMYGMIFSEMKNMIAPMLRTVKELAR